MKFLTFAGSSALPLLLLMTPAPFAYEMTLPDPNYVACPAAKPKPNLPRWEYSTSFLDDYQSIASKLCRPLIEAKLTSDFEWTDGEENPMFSKTYMVHEYLQVNLAGDCLKAKYPSGEWKHIGYTCLFDFDNERAIEAWVQPLLP